MRLSVNFVLNFSEHYGPDVTLFAVGTAIVVELISYSFDFTMLSTSIALSILLILNQLSHASRGEF